MLGGMKTLGVVGATILALVTTACSSSSDGPATPTLACGSQELKVSGTLDGEGFDLVRRGSGYAFTNKIGADPGTMDVSSPQGALSIEFNKLIANGASGPARGSFTDTEGALSVGNCESGDFVSTLSADADGNGVHFTLRNLSREPYCGGAAVSGELSGCFGFTR